MDPVKPSTMDKDVEVDGSVGEVTSTEYEYYCSLRATFTDERLSKLVRKIEFVKSPLCHLWRSH
jgi:hypothetical protein